MSIEDKTVTIYKLDKYGVVLALFPTAIAVFLFFAAAKVADDYLFTGAGKVFAGALIGIAILGCLAFAGYILNLSLDRYVVKAKRVE